MPMNGWQLSYTQSPQVLKMYTQLESNMAMESSLCVCVDDLPSRLS